MEFQTYRITCISLEYYIQQVPCYKILCALDCISCTGDQNNYTLLETDDQNQHK